MVTKCSKCKNPTEKQRVKQINNAICLKCQYQTRRNSVKKHNWNILEYRENHVVFKEKIEGRYVIVSIPYGLLAYIVDFKIKKQ